MTGRRPSGAAPVLLDLIQERAIADRSRLSDASMTIGAVWETEYAAKLRPGASALHLKHVCVQTDSIGSCYLERTANNQPTVTETLLGRNILDLDLDPMYWRIAALDAVFASIVSPPVFERIVEGPAADRALQRAQIVVDEVLRIAKPMTTTGQVRIVNVGVVGDFLEILHRCPDVTLSATDFYSAIRNRTIHGAKVRDGSFTLQEVRDADLALVTGMTLATETLDEILATARESGTKVVIFAETGAHFADIYLDAGADVVVAEPFPFYLSGAQSCLVRVYRRSEKRDRT